LFKNDFKLLDPNNLPKSSVENIYSKKVFQEKWEYYVDVVDNSDDCIEDPFILEEIAHQFFWNHYQIWNMIDDQIFFKLNEPYILFTKKFIPIKYK
jgi:hypothetical protein